MRYQIGDLINIKSKTSEIRNGEYIIIKVEKGISYNNYTVDRSFAYNINQFDEGGWIADKCTKLINRSKMGELLYK